jgi:GGDEF domain-containing protein
LTAKACGRAQHERVPRGGDFTEVRPDDERLDTVLTRANQELYAAKRAGCNRWSFAA